MKVETFSFLESENSCLSPNPDFDISLDWLVADKGPMFYKGKAQMAEDENMAAVMGDVKDLLAHMERIPLLRYEVLTVFHRFKLEHKELLET